MARPKKEDSERKSERIVLRVTSELKADLQQRAERLTKEKNLSKYLQTTLERLVKGELKYRPKV